MSDRRYLLVVLGILGVLGTGLCENASGPALDVLDQLNDAYPNTTIGVDPYIAPTLMQKSLTLNPGEDWRDDLKEALGAVDLTIISLKKYDHIVVTSQTSLFMYKGFEALEAGRFDIANRYFGAAVAKAPDDMQAQTMQKITAELGPAFAEVSKRIDSVERALKDDRSDEVVFKRIARYDESWMGFWEDFWAYYGQALRVGLQTELAPLLLFGNKQLAQYRDMLQRCQLKHPDSELYDAIVQVKDLQRSFAETMLAVEGNLNKAKLLIDKGEAQYAEGKMDLALISFENAFDLFPSDLKTRTYLAWLQADLRQERRAEEAALRKTIAKKVDRVERRLLTRQCVKVVRANSDAARAQVMLDLTKVEGLEFSLNADEERALKFILESDHQKLSTGLVNGLVTRGGEFSGGELFPVSVTLGPRTDTTRRHELVINDSAKAFDRNMLTSFVQALSWLDIQSGNILYKYKITIHFKDLESAKGGDSLGAALATAAYSSLYNLPVRSGVTMTGSVRAYGGIAAVGGIPAKVEAAIKAVQNTLLLPKDNEMDLLMLSHEQLIGMRIVLTEKMDDYIGVVLDHQSGGKGGGDPRLAERYFVVATVLEMNGYYPEALAAYSHAATLVSNDYSSQHCRKLYESAHITPAAPAWLESLVTPSKAPATTRDMIDEKIALNLEEQLTTVADILTAHAAICMGEEATRNAGSMLLDTALAIKPDSRNGLLMKAKLIKSIPIKPDADDKLVTKVEAADQLNTFAKRLASESVPSHRILSALYYALILEFFQPTHEGALIAFVKRDTPEETFNVESLRTRYLKALEAEQQPSESIETADNSSSTSNLTPMQVPDIDLASLPETGGIWGDFGKRDKADGGNDFVDDETAVNNEPVSVEDAPKSEGIRIELGGLIEDIKTGGDGAFLAIKLQTEAKVAVVNMNQHKLIGKIKINNNDSVICAGKSILLSYDRVSGEIRSYSLSTGRYLRKLTSPGVVTAMQMGANDDDLALLRVAVGTGALDRVAYYTLDPQRMRIQELSGRPRNGSYRDFEHLRMTSDGRYFSAWCTSHSPTGAICGSVAKDTISVNYEHSSYGFIVPVERRNVFVTASGKILNANCNVIKDLKMPLFPDLQGRFIVGLGPEGKLIVFDVRTYSPIGSLNIQNFPVTTDSRATYSWAKNDFTLDRQIAISSRHNYLSAVALEKNAIIIYKLPDGLHRLADAQGTLSPPNTTTRPPPWQ